MIRLAADENFNNAVIRNLRNRVPEIDLVRIQDTEIVGADDDTMLEWTANQGRLLLTHDVRTIPNIFADRINKGLPVPGVFLVRRYASPDPIAADLELIFHTSQQTEWEANIFWLPL
jgi:hypothetical protein